jgi:hypothetical protein
MFATLYTYTSKLDQKRIIKKQKKEQQSLQREINRYKEQNRNGGK